MNLLHKRACGAPPDSLTIHSPCKQIDRIGIKEFIHTAAARGQWDMICMQVSGLLQKEQSGGKEGMCLWRAILVGSFSRSILHKKNVQLIR